MHECGRRGCFYCRGGCQLAKPRMEPVYDETGRQIGEECLSYQPFEAFEPEREVGSDGR